VAVSGASAGGSADRPVDLAEEPRSALGRAARRPVPLRIPLAGTERARSVRRPSPARPTVPRPIDIIGEDGLT